MTARPHPARRSRGWPTCLLALGSAVLLWFVAGCSQVDGGRQAEPAPSGADCTVAQLPLKNPGRLTVGTDDPAYEPWFSADNPNNGNGFESALTYAIAAELGFESEQVDWIAVPFTSTIAPGEKPFDIALNQVTITDQRRQNVDLSTGYFTTAQAVVTLEGSAIAGATTIDQLRSATFAAQADSTSLAAITEQIRPDTEPEVFGTNAEAIEALRKRDVDGLVVDLQTGIQLTVSGQVEGGLVVGRLPQPEAPEEFGVVLTQGSKLTPCINQTITTLTRNGTLGNLQREWLPTAEVPALS